jgi:hypothetical protein
MSIIRAIKHRLGLSVTPANNFVLDASADNGTMKLARESGQDIMTVDAAGKVAFSIGIFGFVYGSGATGEYLKLPSWLNSKLIQWGTGVTVAGVYDFNYPIPFVLSPIMYCSEATTAFAAAGFLACGAIGINGGRVSSSNGAGASSAAQKTVTWIAIGGY